MGGVGWNQPPGLETQIFNSGIRLFRIWQASAGSRRSKDAVAQAIQLKSHEERPPSVFQDDFGHSDFVLHFPSVLLGTGFLDGNGR